MMTSESSPESQFKDLRTLRVVCELGLEPDAQVAPLSFHGCLRDLEDLGDLGHLQADEESQEDDLRLTRILVLQFVERLIEGDEISFGEFERDNLFFGAEDRCPVPRTLRNPAGESTTCRLPGPVGVTFPEPGRSTTKQWPEHICMVNNSLPLSVRGSAYLEKASEILLLLKLLRSRVFRVDLFEHPRLENDQSPAAGFVNSPDSETQI